MGRSNVASPLRDKNEGMYIHREGGETQDTCDHTAEGKTTKVAEGKTS